MCNLNNDQSNWSPEGIGKNIDSYVGSVGGQREFLKQTYRTRDTTRTGDDLGFNAEQDLYDYVERQYGKDLAGAMADISLANGPTTRDETYVPHMDQYTGSNNMVSALSAVGVPMDDTVRGYLNTYQGAQDKYLERWQAAEDDRNSGFVNKSLQVVKAVAPGITKSLLIGGGLGILGGVTGISTLANMSPQVQLDKLAGGLSSGASAAGSTPNPLPPRGVIFTANPVEGAVTGVNLGNGGLFSTTPELYNSINPTAAWTAAGSSSVSPAYAAAALNAAGFADSARMLTDVVGTGAQQPSALDRAKELYDRLQPLAGVAQGVVGAMAPEVVQQANDTGGAEALGRAVPSAGDEPFRVKRKNPIGYGNGLNTGAGDTALNIKPLRGRVLGG
jgi:hypothetical protein